MIGSFYPNYLGITFALLTMRRVMDFYINVFFIPTITLILLWVLLPIFLKGGSKQDSAAVDKTVTTAGSKNGESSDSDKNKSE